MAATPTSSLGFQNFFQTTLTNDILATDVDIPMDNIPAVSEGFLVIEPDSTSNREVIYYDSKTALKVICPSAADGRGQDDTTAHSHSSGATVIMAPVAAHFEALQSLFLTSPQGWTSTGTTVSSVTANGNRSYSLSVADDLTAVVSPGMRLRTTRTVAAPTQCTSLNGTTQYYSKTSPSGMTFTDDFVAGAWVKLSSYAAGEIISRYNGTSGWQMFVNASGQVALQANNAGAANFSYVQTYQSIPLNKWVYVAAQLDMSAFTATTTTSYVMIDGVDVPCSVSRGGTNPTALVQAGDLEIGAANGAATFFPGKIAQAFVSSAKITQANVRTLMSQGLTASLISTNSIISAYSFDNSINDLNTTNANNLTAQGSAVATNADSPFGGMADGTISSTLDYGIVQAISASTITVQVAEGCTIPTSGGVSALYYSTYKSPYGFPGQKTKWSVNVVLGSSNTFTGSTVSWTNPGSMNINIPIGSWAVAWEGVVRQINSVADGYFAQTALSTSSSSVSDADLLAGAVLRFSSTASIDAYLAKSKFVNTTVATPYYLIIKTQAGSGTITLGYIADTTEGFFMLKADNAYL